MKTYGKRFSAATGLVAAAFLVSSCAAEPAPSPAQNHVSAPEPAPAPAPSATEPPEQTHSSEPQNPGFSQEALDERLRNAAWAHDVQEAKQLIAWGADVNAKDATEQSAYLIATSEGRTELLELTIEHGADIAALDSWNGTGLIRAAERGHWEVTGVLLRHGIDPHHVNRIGYEAIHEAVIFGRDDPSYHLTLQVLAAGGASFTTASETEGMTPLQMAYHRGFPGQIAVLEALAAPAPSDPPSALLESAASGDANAVARALRAGAGVDTRSGDGRTALEIAEDAGNSAAAAVIRALGG